MSAKNIGKLGNGVGRIYITEPDGASITSNLSNTTAEVAAIKRDGAGRGPVSAEILPTVELTITTALAGLINAASIDGISQIGAAGVPIIVGDEEQTARDVADAINVSAPPSGPRWTGVAKGKVVVLSAPKGSGDDLNGQVASVTFTGGSTITIEPAVTGGSDGSGVFDKDSGARYFFNDSSAAVAGDLTGSEEITPFIIVKGLQSKKSREDLVIAAGTITPSRVSQLTDLVIDTESAAATDDLDFIDATEFFEGDEVNISGLDPAKVSKLRDKSIGSGNIETANDVSFSTGTPNNNIRLKLVIDAILGPLWFEVGRNPTTPLTAEAFYEAGLPIEAGQRKEEVIAGGSAFTVNVDPPLDESFLQLFTTGLVVLAANTSVAFAGVAKEGQRIQVAYDGTSTLGAFSISIFGYSLTAQEALVGGVTIEAIFVGLGTWDIRKYYDHRKDGLIQEVNLQDDIISTAKLKDDVVTTIKILNDAVTTDKILDSNVTTDKINTGAVTIDKQDPTLNDDGVTLAVSFDTGRLGEYRFYPNFKCNLTKIISRVDEALAATDAGTIQAANTVGNMANGLITHALSAPFGDQQEVSPTTNQDVDPGGGNDHFKFTTAKGTAGGKTTLILFLTRTT